MTTQIELAEVYVYVGIYGTYPIPDGLFGYAVAINNGKPLNDRRTRGARLLDVWGRARDKQEAAA